MQDERNNQQDQPQEPNASQSATATVRPSLPPLEFAVFNAFADWRDESLTNQEIHDLLAALEGRGVYLKLMPREKCISCGQFFPVEKMCQVFDEYECSKCYNPNGRGVITRP